MAFPKKVKLGKQAYKYDPRTIVMGAHLQPEAEPPAEFDYDDGKRVFPLALWGNDQYGDCQLVSEANGLVRLERAESRRTPKMTTQIVVGKYKTMTGCKEPEDANDTGLVMLDSFGDWRHAGWEVGSKKYTIAAYGELDKNNGMELRRAIWLLGGIYGGYALPAYVQGLVSKGIRTWDVPDPNDDKPENQPGSWGGHAMFSKRYNKDGIYALTWGEEVFLTNAFVARYMDEAWAVVDALDTHSRYLNVDALEKALRGLGVNVQTT